MRNRLCGQFSQRLLPTSQIRGNDMGHDVGNTCLWSNTAFVQILLNHYGINPCRENPLLILAGSAATRPSRHEMAPQKQSGLLALGDLLEEARRTSGVGF